MRGNRTSLQLLAGLLLCVSGGAQQAAPKPDAAAKPASAPAPAVKQDAALDVASGYIGGALFLRCFCGDNNLSFDEQGKLVSKSKIVDWTLAGMNILKVERKAPGSVELQGVRAAVKFNSDQGEFARKALTDEKMKITVADTGDPKQLAAALKAMFSVGIDVALQQSTPVYWRHYFDPKLPWPADELGQQAIYMPGEHGAALLPGGELPKTVAVSEPAVVPPTATHRDEVLYNGPAIGDRIQGTILLRLVVDDNGLPHRIQIVRPLGYGLDERAATAIAKFRFAPASREGKPVASSVLLHQDYKSPPPRPE